ncbi:MAG: hypothetical protein U1E65_30670 [Myxococcota bacterium]
MFEKPSGRLPSTGAWSLFCLCLLACGTGAPAVDVDAGHPAVDAGHAAVDASQVVPDAGAAVPDAGALDAAGAALDAEPGDSGVAPEDAGTAMVTLTASISPASAPAGTSFTLEVRAPPITFPDPGGRHYHLYFDGAAGQYAAGLTGTETITSTTGDEGMHTITIYLVDGNHTPLVPRAEVSVQFRVE